MLRCRELINRLPFRRKECETQWKPILFAMDWLCAVSGRRRKIGVTLQLRHTRFLREREGERVNGRSRARCRWATAFKYPIVFVLNLNPFDRKLMCHSHHKSRVPTNAAHSQRAPGHLSCHICVDVVRRPTTDKLNCAELTIIYFTSETAALSSWRAFLCWPDTDGGGCGCLPSLFSFCTKTIWPRFVLSFTLNWVETLKMCTANGPLSAFLLFFFFLCVCCHFEMYLKPKIVLGFSSRLRIGEKLGRKNRREHSDGTANVIYDDSNN